MHKCARSARFVGVAQTLQNKRKSIKITIYSHPKTPKSPKYVSFICKFEPPEFAQLEPSRKAPKAQFFWRRSKIAKQMEINQNDNLFTSKKSRIFKICQLYDQNWTALIRTTWAVLEGSQSTICRRRSKTAKQKEINQNGNLFTSKKTRIFKIC